MRPWQSEPRGKQLEAFVGVWGIHTGKFETSEQLLFVACGLYDLDFDAVKGVEECAIAIEALGKKARAELARKNRAKFLTETSGPVEKPQNTPITADGLEKMMADSTPHMIDGSSMDCVGELDIDPAKLLRKVVSAVISHGQGHVLYDFPEVLAFFGSRIPDREELAGHTGVDERMFEAKAKWPNLDPSKAKRIEAAQ